MFTSTDTPLPLSTLPGVQCKLGHNYSLNVHKEWKQRTRNLSAYLIPLRLPHICYRFCTPCSYSLQIEREYLYKKLSAWFHFMYFCFSYLVPYRTVGTTKDFSSSYRYVNAISPSHLLVQLTAWFHHSNMWYLYCTLYTVHFHLLPYLASTSSSV
jgi:hypothetical protein